jgi:hypothetical protein
MHAHGLSGNDLFLLQEVGWPGCTAKLKLLVCFSDRVSHFFPGWPSDLYPPISASQVAGIAGMQPGP